MRKLFAFILALSLASASAAQSWPQRPVRIVVPAPAGSSLDIIVRKMGDQLKDRWKQPIIVENKAGAGGMLGMDVAAKAPADGYTLAIGFNGPIAFGPHLYKRMPYDPARDLVAIVLTTSQPNVLAISANIPANNLQEFVAWAKRQGDKLTYASVGNGSSSHLTAELFKSEAGFQAVHAPYSGSPPAGLSVANGDTQMVFTVASGLMPLLRGGRIKFIAATGLQRTEALKDIPTVAESGYPGFEAIAWNGLFAAAGTPPEVVNRINADVNAVLQDPDLRAFFGQQGMVVGGGSPAEFKALIERDTKKWGAIITKADIKID